MKKRNHAHVGIAPHSCLGFTGYRGNRSKKCLDVSNGISLVEGFLARVRSVVKVHDLDVSMLSQVVNGVHRPESFCFLCSWPIWVIFDVDDFWQGWCWWCSYQGGRFSSALSWETGGNGLVLWQGWGQIGGHWCGSGGTGGAPIALSRCHRMTTCAEPMSACIFCEPCWGGKWYERVEKSYGNAAKRKKNCTPWYMLR